ncbi:albusnodin/ikarugamycin family macrolactam cyclase [Kitasatospora sp. NPDC058478]|uniref:albusnodin/ikarugamycin family macrolactam cyclase n=1 Tax=unclassified Kitasatospora TaxID=2633591 RepID=UPI00364B6D8D
MGWFGGHLTRPSTAHVPLGARLLWRKPLLWSVGTPVRLAKGCGGRRLAVFGPCGAADAELARLVDTTDISTLDTAATAWSGAYTLVLDDGHGAQLIWSDPIGACPLYSTRISGATVWASSSLALARLRGARPDTTWLAAHLVDPAGWTPGHSAWTDVEQIPPGHRLLARPGVASDTTPYWRRPVLAWHEAVHRLREDLAGAVSSRINGQAVSSDLSGGLDSSTFAALAAGHGPVIAVTYHPKGTATGGDVDHARTVARAFPSIRHEFMALGTEHLPFSALDTLPLTGEPAPSAITIAQLTYQMAMLAGHGARVHLTGDGGDTLFMQPPVHLADLARSGHLLRMARDAQTWARLYRTSPWPALAAAWTNPQALADGASRPPWLTNRAGALAAEATQPYRDVLTLGHADTRLLTEARYVARTAATENQVAAEQGIAMHNPFTDPRVVETVLATDPARRWSARRYKPLLSDAVTGLLPPQVVDRGAKGTFAVDHHHGLRANEARVLDLVDGHLAGLGLIRPGTVRSLLRQALLGVDIPWGRIEPLLGTELWLRAADTATSQVRWEVHAA